MKPRITLSVSADGFFELWLNEQGRDLLIRQLQALSEKNDHFHLDPDGFAEVEASTRAYRPTDSILEYGKVLFRTDDSDRQHYAHVMDGAK